VVSLIDDSLPVGISRKTMEINICNKLLNFYGRRKVRGIKAYLKRIEFDIVRKAYIMILNKELADKVANFVGFMISEDQKEVEEILLLHYYNSSKVCHTCGTTEDDISLIVCPECGSPYNV